MTETMTGTTWTPPAPHERRPAPKPPEKPGPGLDRSDIKAPLPGRPLWAIFGTLLMIVGLGWGTYQVVDLIAHGEKTVDATIPTAGIETINVDNSSGYVEIVGSDTPNIVIHAEISTGLRRTGYGWETDGSTLRVHGTCPLIGSQWCWVKYTIEVPRDIDVVVNNDDSRVEVSNIDGNVDVNADNGRVEATGLSGANANAQSDNGRVELTFTEVPDNVVAQSDNGRIDIAVPSVEGGYDITTQSDNGSETTTGLVNNPESPRVIRAEADNGSITVRATS